MAESMKINKAIRAIMREQNVTLQRMADSLGKKTATQISSRLLSDNMTFDKAIEMLNVLGYEVTIQPRRPGARPSGQYIIKRSDWFDNGKE